MTAGEESSPYSVKYTALSPAHPSHLSNLYECAARPSQRFQNSVAVLSIFGFSGFLLYSFGTPVGACRFAEQPDYRQRGRGDNIRQFSFLIANLPRIRPGYGGSAWNLHWSSDPHLLPIVVEAF